VLPTERPTESAGCAGDCNGDGRVAVAELISAVNVALERAPVSSCAAADANRDGVVRINELIGATNRALRGCA
jgi:hypothetical protein